MTDPRALARRMDAARGRRECDLILKNALYLDVFHCRWARGEIAISEGVIVGMEPGLQGRRTVDLKGKAVVPGFIDAHVHLESSLMTPWHFQEAVLPLGTTSAVCDPHELANVLGPKGIEYFLAAADGLEMDLRVMLSSCVPATHFETNGGGEIGAPALVKLKSHAKALGLAEVMNVPGVLNGDPGVMAKIAAFLDRPVDGHCPLVRGADLSAYAAAGISSCHESSELEEAAEKLGKGISVWIREGSVAKDLEALAPLLTLATSTSIGFCTDDRNPLDLATEGHLDHLVRGSIARGVPMEVAYRSASWSVARHYGLTQGWDRFGAVAPGYRADLVVLEDREACGISAVLLRGIFANEREVRPLTIPDAHLRGTVRASVPEVADLRAPEGKVRVIGVRPGKILTDHLVLDSSAPGVARLSVLERYGKGSKPANAYARGFGENFRGAIASSVGHDSHNLIVVGDQPEEMRIALAAIIESGGGFCVVQSGKVRARLELPLGGLMCAEEPAALKTKLLALKKASREIGCELADPFLQLAFLSLPVIPSLKLTDRGLFDVEKFSPVAVAAG